MTNKIQAVTYRENLCFKCLKEGTQIKKYNLHRSEFGSKFDNYYTHLQLCNNCLPEGIDEWFNEIPETDGYCAIYKYEDKIIEFANSLPLQGQELFWNGVAYGACAYTMDSQDWIDDKLGILPDEVYEEKYFMYSPRQIRAYEERFPTCEYPVNIIYDDNSKGCWCPFGAYGEYGQKISSNINDECFYCEIYKKRETPIKEMSSEMFKQYQMYMKGKQYKDLFEPEE